VARAVELHLAIHEAIGLLEAYREPESAYIPLKPREGNAFGCTEAPRGILWHRYDVDDQGIVRYARIVPPTSQNQGRIEEDIRHSLERLGLGSSDEALRLRAEQVIRNYDPCISCATHFLNLDLRRR
jgi:coenzyme F420-reducing hydrogenase alpha subunit